MNKKPLKLAAYFTMAFFISATLLSCGVKDSTIQTQISEAASTTPALANVTKAVSDGVVTLSGEVSDDASKAACETAVKAIKGVKSVVNNITIAPPPPVVTQPVVAADDALTKGVADATKDFPTVKTSIADGVITLTGEIKRASLPKLMQTLNSLKPKKIDNQLTIK
jgi:hyperosmotically inducible periplasmic protein